jgi:hypothetical protein
MLYKQALHGNWNALRLAITALKEKFPKSTVPLTDVLKYSQVFVPDHIELRNLHTVGSNKFACIRSLCQLLIWRSRVWDSDKL